MKKAFLTTLLVLALGVPSLSLAAVSSSPTKLGKFGYWIAYKMTEARQPVCYMTLTAKPPKPKGSKLNRETVSLMITHRPAEGALDVVSYSAGTKFAPTSEVIFKADGKSFSLFTQEDTAWARDAATDHAITIAIRKADYITITGTATKGGRFVDTISMKGSAKAYREMTKACDLTEPPFPSSK